MTQSSEMYLYLNSLATGGNWEVFTVRIPEVPTEEGKLSPARAPSLGSPLPTGPLKKTHFLILIIKVTSKRGMPGCLGKGALILLRGQWPL